MDMDFRPGLKKDVENDIFLVRNRVGIWRTGQYSPTKNSQEYPPPPGSTYTRGLIEFEKTLICFH